MLELHSDASSLGLHCGGDASFGASVLGMSSCVVAWADAEAMLA